jgi:lipid-A-disaccharide synthase
MTLGGRRAPFIFIIAGEPSGDALGGALIAALRERTGGKAAGCRHRRRAHAGAGLTSLVPLADLAVAGIAEVLPRAPLILRRVRETVAAIREMRPDAVVTIDSSGVQLARRPPAAPPRRAAAADPLRRADGLGLAARPRPPDGALVRSPADPAAVRAALFRARRAGRSYVGHPVLESGAENGDAARFRARTASPRTNWS